MNKFNDQRNNGKHSLKACFSCTQYPLYCTEHYTQKIKDCNIKSMPKHSTTAFTSEVLPKVRPNYAPHYTLVDCKPKIQVKEYSTLKDRQESTNPKLIETITQNVTVSKQYLARLAPKERHNIQHLKHGDPVTLDLIYNEILSLKKLTKGFLKINQDLHKKNESLRHIAEPELKYNEQKVNSKI